MQRLKTILANSKTVLEFRLALARLGRKAYLQLLKKEEIKSEYNFNKAKDRLLPLLYTREALLNKSPKRFVIRPPEWVEAAKKRQHERPLISSLEAAWYLSEITSDCFNVFNSRILIVKLIDRNGQIIEKSAAMFNYLNEDMKLEVGTICDWGIRKGFKRTSQIVHFYEKAIKATALSYSVLNKDLNAIKHVQVD